MSLLLLLQIAHVLSSILWVGTDLVLTLILLPRLKALGPAIERPVMKSLMRVLPPVIMVTSLTVLATGFLIIWDMGGWDSLLTTNWGRAISTGIALTTVALIVGFGMLPPLTIKYEKLYAATEGRGPTAEEAERLDTLAHRATILARVNSALLIVTVLAMIVARFS